MLSRPSLPSSPSRHVTSVLLFSLDTHSFLRVWHPQLDEFHSEDHILWASERLDMSVKSQTARCLNTGEVMLAANCHSGRSQQVTHTVCFLIYTRDNQRRLILGHYFKKLTQRGCGVGYTTAASVQYTRI